MGWPLDYRELTLTRYYRTVGCRPVPACLLPRLVPIAALLAAVYSWMLTPHTPPVNTAEVMVRIGLILAGSIGLVFAIVVSASLIIYGAGCRNSLPRNAREELRGRLRGVTIVFSIVTRGDNPRLAARCARSVRYWVRRLEPVYGFRGIVEIVSDRDSEELRRLADRFVVVPECYRTRRGSLFKARALQYSVEARGRDGLVGENTWIYHIDDDTIIGEDTVTGVAYAIAKAMESDRPPLLFMGELAASNNVMENILTTIADFQRSAYTLTLYALTYGLLGRPLLGLIGNNYLVNSVAEARVGYDAGRESLCEDSWFALRFYSIYGGRAAWMPARAYEEPVHSIKDLIKQRRRWYWGTLLNAFSKTIPFRARAAYLAMTLLWSISPLGVIPALIGLLLLGRPPFDPLASALGGLATTTIILWYTIGGWRTLAVHSERPLRYLAYLATPILVPLVLWFEALAVVCSWVSPPKTFERVKRSVKAAEGVAPLIGSGGDSGDEHA